MEDPEQIEVLRIARISMTGPAMDDLPVTDHIPPVLTALIALLRGSTTINDWLRSAASYRRIPLVLSLISVTALLIVNRRTLGALGNALLGNVRALVSAGADVNLQGNGGFSPLTIASRKGHVDTVVMLLESGANTEMRDNVGRTALWYAAASGWIDVLDALTAHGADVDAADYRRRSPLCQAAIKGHVNVVKILIQGGAKIVGEEGDCDDPLSCVAIWGKHHVKEILLLLMNNGAYRPIGDVTDQYNETALMCAVYKGDLDPVKILVECGADIHARNVDNLQAIDIASYCGHVDIIEFLYDHLTCIESSCLSSSACIDYNCNTAVHLTTNVECMRSLLENGADVEAENVDGLRPIHCAVRTGLVELVELLIQHGANVDAADVYGNSPLHEAVCHGLSVVQLLVDHGAKLNVQNVDGKTPLHVAIERQQSEVVMFLLNVGADVELTDVWRNTPLHYLTAGQLSDAHKKYVVRQNPSQQLVIRNAVGVTALSSVAAHEHVDCYGNTPLHHAVGVYGHLKMYRVSTDVIKTVEFLVKSGANINAQNNEGRIPLQVARGKQAFEACLQHADDQSFTITDKRGRNFWHLLFLFRNPREIELAANKQPKISASYAKYASDDLNRTPLHYACMNRNASIAQSSWLSEVFIQEFSDEHINKQDVFGRTALHYAAMAGNTELMDLLKTKKAADIQDKFKNSADEYSKTCRNYNVNVSRLRLVNTSKSCSEEFPLNITLHSAVFFSQISRSEQL